MKKLFFTTAAAIAAVIFTGCTELRLAEGIYTTNLSGREDVAMVCNDLIFLRLRNAEDDTLDNGFSAPGLLLHHQAGDGQGVGPDEGVNRPDGPVAGEVFLKQGGIKERCPGLHSPHLLARK